MTRDEWERQASALAKRGFDLPQTKVPPLGIISIRADAAKRKQMRDEITATLSNEALAKKWNVHVRTIEKILSFETGRHVA